MTASMYIIVSIICHFKKIKNFLLNWCSHWLILKILQLKMRDILSHNAHLMRYHECLVICIKGTHTGIQLESGPRHTSPHKVFCSDAATARTTRLHRNLLTSSLFSDAFTSLACFASKQVYKDHTVVDSQQLQQFLNKTAKAHEGKESMSESSAR